MKTYTNQDIVDAWNNDECWKIFSNLIADIRDKEHQERFDDNKQIKCTCGI